MKDTCTFERASLWVSEQRPLLSQAAKSYVPFQKLVKLDLYFCLHGGRPWRTSNLDNQKLFSGKKCGFPGPKALPYPAGVAVMREAMKGKG